MPQPTGCTAPPRPDHSRVASASSAVAQRLMDEIAKPNGQFMIVPSQLPHPASRSAPASLSGGTHIACQFRRDRRGVARQCRVTGGKPNIILEILLPGWVNAA